MADYTHLSNIIQGEVIRVQERRPIAEQADCLEVMILFLKDQIMAITVAKLKIAESIREDSQ